MSLQNKLKIVFVEAALAVAGFVGVARAQSAGDEPIVPDMTFYNECFSNNPGANSQYAEGNEMTCFRSPNIDALNGSARMLGSATLNNANNGTGGGVYGIRTITVEDLRGLESIPTPEGNKSFFTYNLDKNGAWVNGVEPPRPINQLLGNYFTRLRYYQSGDGVRFVAPTYNVPAYVAGRSATGSSPAVPGITYDAATLATFIGEIYVPQASGAWGGAAKGTQVPTAPALGRAPVTRADTALVPGQ